MVRFDSPSPQGSTGPRNTAQVEACASGSLENYLARYGELFDSGAASMVAESGRFKAERSCVR